MSRRSVPPKAAPTVWHDVGWQAHPTYGCWGRGSVGQQYDVMALWRERAVDVRGEALDCGHFVGEEAPEATLKALLEFLG